MQFPAGTRLGPYEIVAPLGAGGMGEVYRARDPRLGREVAIKVLPEHLAKDQQALARFEREARAVAALSHPNILAVYDVGAHAGTSFVVTELLEGETLRDRLNRSAVPWRKTIEIGVAIADGLAAAHSKEIIHRDLKPANIFLTSDGRVKILDFGLARWKPSISPQEETQTQTGTVMGTVGYMSPEQVRGTAAETQSDIFSLGCVLYEMVTGRRAFGGSSAGDTMAAILKDDPPSMTGSGMEVPGELQRVVERCLAKNPGERFHSAHDLAFALRGILTAPVTAAAPVVAPSRMRLVGVMVVLVVLVTGAILYWLNRPRAGVDSLAVMPFANASGDRDSEYLSDGITDSLIDSLSQVPGLRVMSRSSVFRYKGREMDVQKVGKELGVRAVLTGRVMQRGDSLSVTTELVNVEDNSHLWGGQYNRKLADALAVQNDIASQISDKLKMRLTSEQKTQMVKHQSDNPEAYQLFLKGRYYATSISTEGLNKGLDYFRQAIALDPNYALAYDGISLYYAGVDDLSMAPSEAMPRAKEAAQKALDLDDTLPQGHVEMANVHTWYDWDWPAAEREYRRAIELNPNLAVAHGYYGWFLTWMGRTEEGLAENRRAEALDPLSGEVSFLLGADLYYAHRYDQAIIQLRKGLDLYPNQWPAQEAIGQSYEELAKYPEAIAAFQQTRRMEDSVAMPLADLARAYAVAGRRADAQKALDELLARSRRGHVPAYGIARVYAGLGDKDQAMAWLEKSYAARSYLPVFMKMDPELDSLRSDVRFQDLLRRMNFPR